MSIRLTESEKQQALALLLSGLSIESVNHGSREADMADFLKGYFADTSYICRVQMIDELRGNFVMDVPGKTADSLVIWNGHMDTVPYGDRSAWDTDPAKPEIRGGRVYGRGTSDMKSGLCAMAYALHYLAERGLEPSEHIRFIGTCDEEKNGDGAAAICEAGLLENPSFVLIGEPTNCNLGIAQKGCMWLKFHLKGKTSHGAYPWMGVNAAELGYEFIRSFKDYIGAGLHPVLDHATATITGMQGGVANNMLPDDAVFITDVRTVPSVNHTQIREWLTSAIEEWQKNYPGLEIEYEVLNERIPIAIAPDHARCEAVRRCAENVSEVKPVDMGIYFFTDASVFLKDHMAPCLLYGPGDPALCHKPNESMELDLYYRAIETYIELALS